MTTMLTVLKRDNTAYVTGPNVPFMDTELQLTQKERQADVTGDDASELLKCKLRLRFHYDNGLHDERSGAVLENDRHEKHISEGEDERDVQHLQSGQTVRLVNVPVQHALNTRCGHGGNGKTSSKNVHIEIANRRKTHGQYHSGEKGDAVQRQCFREPEVLNGSDDWNLEKLCELVRSH